MLDAPIERMAASPLEGLADGLARIGIGAIAVTCFGFACGMAAAGMIATGDYLQAVIFLVLNRAADILDDVMARRSRVTALSAFLAGALGMFVYAAIPFAFALAHQQDGLAAAFVMMGVFVAAVPGLVTRAVSAHANVNAARPSPFILVGHSETFIAFVLMCLAPRWMFSILAYLFGVLCFISAGIGVGSAMAALRAPTKP